MRSKSVLLLVAIMAVLFVYNGDVFGQIQWRGTPNGVVLTSKDPGDTVTVTLNILLGQNSQLTKGDWLDIDLSDFQFINSSVSTDETKYAFSSPSAYNMDNDGSDFEVAQSPDYPSDPNIMRVSLTGDLALLPADSVQVVITGALRNKGRSDPVATSGDDADFRVRVRSADQPLFSSDNNDESENKLDPPNTQEIVSFFSYDSTAGNNTYMTFVDSTDGMIPADGQILVDLPSGFTFSSTDLDSVWVRKGPAPGTLLNLASVATSGNTATITLNETSPVDDDVRLFIQIGSPNFLYIQNHLVYSGALPDTFDTRNYVSGTDWTIVGADADGDTIFVDDAAGSTFPVYSNWFPSAAYSDSVGGVSIADNRAGQNTKLDMWFKLSTTLDSTSDTLVVKFDTNAFTVDATQAGTAGNYTFTGSTFTFGVDGIGSDTDGEVKFWVTSGSIPRGTLMQLTVNANVLRNSSARIDVDMGIRTSDQTGFVYDRETDAILSSPGSVFTAFTISDSSSLDPAAVTSLQFTTSSYIPQGGQIVLEFPPEFDFTGITSLDSIFITVDSAGLGTEASTDTLWKSNASRPAGAGRYGAAASETFVGDNIVIQLSSGNYAKDIAPNSVITFNQIGFMDANYSDPAFILPAPEDAGMYPSAGNFGAFFLVTRTSTGNEISRGDNGGVPKTVYTNDWGMAGYEAAHGASATTVDTHAVFVDGVTFDPITAATAGHTVAARLMFTVGEHLYGGGAVYINFGDDLYLDEFQAAETDNFRFVYGMEDAPGLFTALNFTPTFDPDSNALIITTTGAAGATDNGTFWPDSLYVLEILTDATAANNAQGTLRAKGQRVNTDFEFRLWTSEQLSPVLTDTGELTLQVDPVDSLYALSITKTDSTIGKSSTDSLILVSTEGFFPNGSKFGIKLESGFEFVDPSPTDINTLISVEHGLGSGQTALLFTATRVDADSLVITLQDSLGNGDNVDQGVAQDTLRILFGDGTTDLIQNPDDVSNTSRRTEFQAASGQRIFNVTAYDETGALMMKHRVDNDPAGSAAYIVQNFFGPTSISANASNSDLADAEPDTAGGLIDSLWIPFQVGTPVTGDGATPSIMLKFKGMAFVSEAAAEIDANYEFLGDETNLGAGATYASIDAVGDDSVAITLTGVQIVGDGGTDADLQAVFLDTLLIINNTMRWLGASPTGNDSGHVTIYTSEQPIATVDTTTIVPWLPRGITQDLVGITGANDVGQTALYKNGFDPGTFHGALLAGGKVVVKVPASQDSSKTPDSNGEGFYGYSFVPSLTDGIPVSSHDDYFRVVGGRVAGLDTLTITSVDYDLDVASVDTEVDTAVFTINISSAESAIEADSTLTVEMRSFLKMPFEATNGGPAPGTFLNTVAASVDYNILIEVQAPDGSLISTSNDAGGYDADAGAASTYMVLVDGQQHDPGGLLQASEGIMGDPTATTVGTGVSFVVLAVDQYGNIDQSVDNNEYVNIETAHGGVQELATLRHAPDDNVGADGDLTFVTGYAQYAVADSFRFHKAGDGVAALSTADVSRSVYKSILASQADGSRSGTSENISVANDVAENALVLIPGETYVAGDSAAQGKTDTGQELSANGTYTITVYPVDQYYNRTDSTFSLSEVLSITTSGGAVTLIPTDGDTSFSASAVATFTVKPTAAGTDTINVTITSGAFTATGQASFDVIAAVATAVFDAFASDSTEVSGRIMPYTVNLAFPGTFEDGGGWSVYLFGDSNITTVTQEPGIQELVSGITTGEGTSTPAAYSANANVAVNTNEGEEYYLFAALPEVSNQIIGKSDGFIILHQPVVDTDITKVTPSDMDSVLNSGGDNDPLTDPQKAVNIEFAVIDADQGPAEVDVYIFLHEENDLTKDDYVAGDIQLDGTNGILISSGLDESDTVFDFDITDALPGGEPRAPAGDYYVYVVAYDQKNANIGRSDNVLTVKHAPNITLDRPANGVTPINTSSQHIFTFSWPSGFL
ncbi:hypothetical protein ACFL4Q_02730 [candidate division KSB1 bacterium]